MSEAKDMNKFSVHGFTAVDNRVFYLQELLSPSAFGILLRIYRMTEGYSKPCVALSNGYFQKICNMSKNTVSKTVKELEDLGVLLTRRRARASTYYQINMSRVFELFNEIQERLSLSIEVVEDKAVFEEDFTKNTKDVTLERPEVLEEVFEKQSAPKVNKIPFEDFWSLYAKKVDSAKCRKKWENLTFSKQQIIMQHIPRYVESTPDIKFRKNPLTYLNGECWNDEIVIYKNKRGSDYASNKPSTRQYQEGKQQLTYEERMQQQFNEVFQ